ncbi:MAG: hypothetical protein ACXVEF_16425 [Polyangiales bacterium]
MDAAAFHGKLFDEVRERLHQSFARGVAGVEEDTLCEILFAASDHLSADERRAADLTATLLAAIRADGFHPLLVAALVRLAAIDHPPTFALLRMLALATELHRPDDVASLLTILIDNVAIRSELKRARTKDPSVDAILMRGVEIALRSGFWDLPLLQIHLLSPSAATWLELAERALRAGRGARLCAAVWQAIAESVGDEREAFLRTLSQAIGSAPEVPLVQLVDWASAF